MGVRSLQAITVNLVLKATVQNQLDDSQNIRATHPDVNYAPSLTSGIDANQANRGWQSLSRTLTTGNSETIDLYDMGSLDVGAGAGLDGVGQAIVHEEIVAIAIVNNNAIGAAGQLEIIPAAANGWTPIGTNTVANGNALRGQGCLFRCQPAANGLDITDASSNQITTTANGGDVTYSIYLLARHDDEESSSSSSSSSSSTSTASSLSSSSWSSPSSQTMSMSSASSASSLSSSSLSSSSWSSQS